MSNSTTDATIQSSNPSLKDNEHKNDESFINWLQALSENAGRINNEWQWFFLSRIEKEFLSIACKILKFEKRARLNVAIEVLRDLEKFDSGKKPNSPVQ